MLSTLKESVKHTELHFVDNVQMTLQDRILAAMKYAGANQASIAKHLKVSRAAVSMWMNGQTKEIKSKYAMPLATMLGVNQEWLAYGKGEMLDSNIREAPAALYFSGKGVPLISWVKAGDFCESSDVYEPGYAEDYLPRPKGCSDKTYALRVKGDSMTSPYPGSRSYPDGVIIYVDPAKEVLTGHRGIFRIPDSNEVTFKELVADAGDQYLKPLNPQYDKIKVTPAMVCCGRVIGSFLPE